MLHHFEAGYEIVLPARPGRRGLAERVVRRRRTKPVLRQQVGEHSLSGAIIQHGNRRFLLVEQLGYQLGAIPRPDFHVVRIDAHIFFVVDMGQEITIRPLAESVSEGEPAGLAAMIVDRDSLQRQKPAIALLATLVEVHDIEKRASPAADRAGGMALDKGRKVGKGGAYGRHVATQIGMADNSPATPLRSPITVARMAFDDEPGPEPPPRRVAMTLMSFEPQPILFHTLSSNMAVLR